MDPTEHNRYAGLIARLVSIRFQLASLRDDRRRNRIYPEEYVDMRDRGLRLSDEIRAQINNETYQEQGA